MLLAVMESQSVTKLLIATPNRGHVSVQFMKSIVKLVQFLHSKTELEFSFKTFEFSDIVMSRNYLMSFFLSHREFTHLLFIDSDMAWEPIQVERLLQRNEDFVCAHCPDRRPDWRLATQMLREHIDQPDHAIDVDDIIGKTQRYVSVKKLPDKLPFKTIGADEFETVAAVGMAFVMLKRTVPEMMVAKRLAKPFPRMAERPLFSDATHFYDFFSHIATQDGALMSEDQSFCYRWVVGCGGDIWADSRSKVDHVGDYVFRGAYFNSIQRQKGIASQRTLKG